VPDSVAVETLEYRGNRQWCDPGSGADTLVGHPTDHQQVTVANIKSQIKRNRQNLKRHQRNRGVRSEINTRTRTAREAIDNDAPDADEAVRLAVKRIDKAAQKGVLHKNTAARNKSRLVRRLNAQDEG